MVRREFPRPESAGTPFGSGLNLFRIARLDLVPLQLVLQRGLGVGLAGQPALLAFSDGAAWQVQQRIVGEARAHPATPSIAGVSGPSNLGSRRFGGRGIGGGRFNFRASAALPTPGNLYFYHD